MYKHSLVTNIVLIAFFNLWAIGGLNAQYFDDSFQITYDNCDGCATITFLLGNHELAGFQDRIGWMNIRNSEGNLILDINATGAGGTWSSLKMLGGGGATLYYRIYGNGSISRFENNNKTYVTFKHCYLPVSDFGNQTSINITGWYDYVPGTGEEFGNTVKSTTSQQGTIGTPTLSSVSNDVCGTKVIKWSNNDGSVNACLDSKKHTRIERRSIGGTWQLLPQVIQFPTSEFNDTFGAPGVEYEYRVYHVYSPNIYRSDSSPYSSIKSGENKDKPASPTNVQSTIGTCENYIGVNWEYGNSTDIDGFNVYRRVQGTSVFSLMNISGLIANSERSYEDNSANNTSLYEYKVQAVNDCPLSSNDSNIAIGSREGASGSASLTSIVPETGIGANEITINWSYTPNATDQGFKIVRQGGGATETVDIPDLSKRTYTDLNALGCIEYSYSILTFSECNPNGSGNGIIATGELLPDLSQAFATDGSGFIASKGYYTDRVELTWTNNNSAQTTEIQIGRRLFGSTGPFTNITTISGGSEIYQDNSTDAGVFYEYEITAYALCRNNYIPSNIVTTSGFRSKSGIVSGKVTFDGGNPVKDVKIVGESTTGADEKSLRLNGPSSKIMINTSKSIDSTITDELILESWVQFNNTTFNNSFDLFHQTGAINTPYKFHFDSGTGNVIFNIRDEDGTVIEASITKDSFPLNEWFHIAAELEGDSIVIYKDGDALAKGCNSNFDNLLPSTSVLNIGCNYNGYLKETRLWNVAKDSITFKQDYSRFATGTENGLLIQFLANEGLGDYVYDRSKDGQLFNRNDGKIINGTWEQLSLPTRAQLGLATYTDDDGNYTLLLPYANAGELFTITPIFFPHEFDPTNKDVFIGDGSPVINGVDFLDISSFLVTGSLRYHNTNCPVPNAFVLLDNDFITTDLGGLLMTDANGEFETQVPIGNHSITLKKDDHYMSFGRYPPSGTLPFVEPVTKIEFIDSTFVKVVGRVVGGTREADRVPGLGESINNIGKATIKFTSLAFNGCFEQTFTTVDSSGEYIAYLPPQAYAPEVRVISNPSLNTYFDNNTEVIDLSTSLDSLSSMVIKTNGTPLDDTLTVNYNKRLDYIYLVNPVIDVVDENGLPFIGDETYTYTDPQSGITTTQNLRTNPFHWPVFTQGSVNEKYWMGVKAFEIYKNFDPNATITTDSVPFTDGQIIIDNKIAELEPYLVLDIPESYNSDTLKTLWHEFLPGTPNTNQGGAGVESYGFTKTLSVSIKKNNGDIIDWLAIPASKSPNGDRSYRAYLLGGIVRDPGELTLGPEVPEYVLRDPPGSQSNATRTVNTSRTELRSWNWNFKGSTSVSDDIYVGAEFTVGLGTATATEVFNNISVGYTSSVSGGRSGALKTTVTNSEAISTSSSSSFVGSNGDIYIGQSQNILVGETEYLQLVPETIGNVDFKDNTGIPDLNGFKLAGRYSLSVSPKGYETRFSYSQKQLEVVVIPNLKDTRNKILQAGGKYVCVECDVDDENYGKDNDDPDWGAAASMSCPDPEVTDCPDVLTGPSYTYNATGNTDLDSVRWLNQQIRLWEKAIALNEWEKANIDNPLVIDSIRDEQLNELDTIYKEYLVQFAALTAAEAGGFIAAAVANIVAVSAPVGGAIVGNVGFFVTTGTSIAKHETSQKFLEYEAKKKRIEDRFNATGAQAKTFDSGASISASMSQQTAMSTKNKIAYHVGTSLQQKIGAKVNGNGLAFVRNIKLDYNSSTDWGQDSSTTEVVSYNIKDGNTYDGFSVNVYPSLLGWGPIFKRIPGGQTSCPYEAEEVSKYYKPGTILSADTRQMDKPTIAVSPSILTNIPADDQAIFNLTLGNETESDPARGRTYIVEVVSASNPFGAIVKFDGFESTSAYINPATQINKVLSIEMSPNGIYQHDSIQLKIYPECQPLLFEIAYVSAHFQPTCSDVELAVPEDQWVMNSSYKDTLPVSIIGYNLNFPDFKRIRLDFKSIEDPNWLGIKSFYKDTIGLNDTSAIEIPDNLPSTNFMWDVGAIQLTDGAYDLRAFTECRDAPDQIRIVSTTHRGIIDRVNPHAFGSPSPADGVLDPDDDIIMKMNEPIDIGSVTPFNFEIRGLLNGAPLEHETSLCLDGIDDYGEIPEYQLQQRTLTVEFWTKRNSNGEQMLISQGASTADKMSVKFNAANKVQFDLGNGSITSSSSILDDSDWHHIAIVYDRDSTSGEIFIDFGRDKTVSNFIADYNATGPIYLGQSAYDNTPNYEGCIHELRLWSIAKTESQIAGEASLTLSGRENGLIGLWSLSEGIGTTSEDQVRSRHIQIHEGIWSILPQNHSFMLDGIDDYIKLDTAGTLAFGDDADLTFEGWFKSTASGDQVIMSNGKADGLNNDISSWVIMLSQGSLIVQNNGQSLSSGTDLNNGDWHHFSIVVERTRAVTIYIDGEAVSTANSNIFEGFGGPKLWIGCRGYNSSNVEQRDQFFNGKLDDIRIWNVARKPEQVTRDYVYQMSGDELGLQAYYPFDGITVIGGINIRTPDLVDASSNYYDLSLGASTTSQYSEDAPPVQLPRLVEKVNFTYSINNDEVFLKITEPPARIENVTLDITVEGLKDAAGNVMESPETWIAYIDKNQVFWETEYFQFEKDFDDPMSFTSKIKNTGGSQESYTVSNVPSWMSASPTSGIIEPNSEIEVTFTIQPLINIGEYEQDIYVSTESFGFNERLLLDLKVVTEPPLWEVDPTLFSNSMNLIGEFSINDVISTDDEDLISVWVNNELRGVTNVEYDPASGKHLVFLTILSNQSYGETIDFRAWDASTGRTLTDVTPINMIFQSNDVKGSKGFPIPIKAQLLTKLQYILNPGWNWISFPLASTILDDVDATLSDLGSDTDDEVKSQEAFKTYYGTWRGDLAGFDTNEGYKIKVAHKDTFCYEGTFIDPALEPISIKQGWNWIGMKSLYTIDVASALSSLDPMQGDLIKGQYGFAIYDELFGWGGNLNTLEPLESYMLKYHEDDLLTFPNNGGVTFSAQQSETKRVEAKRWKGFNKSLSVNNESYSGNMSLTASIASCVIEELTQDVNPAEWMLVAYVDGECRGIADPSYISQIDEYRYYLPISGNQSAELTFKLVHQSSGDIIALGETITYANNDIVGNTSTPYEFTCESISTCPEELLVSTVDLSSYIGAIDLRANYSIASSAIVPSNTNLSIKAGNHVQFNEGFSIPSDTELDVIIEACDGSSSQQN